jgi:hypothetical protein
MSTEARAASTRRTQPIPSAINQIAGEATAKMSSPSAASSERDSPRDQSPRPIGAHHAGKQAQVAEPDRGGEEDAAIAFDLRVPDRRGQLRDPAAHPVLAPLVARLFRVLDGGLPQEPLDHPDNRINRVWRRRRPRPSTTPGGVLLTSRRLRARSSPAR